MSDPIPEPAESEEDARRLIESDGFTEVAELERHGFDGWHALAKNRYGHLVGVLVDRFRKVQELPPTHEEPEAPEEPATK